MTYTKTRTMLEPGKLYKVRRNTFGHYLQKTKQETSRYYGNKGMVWRPYKFDPGSIIFAVNDKDYPKWAMPTFGYWVLFDGRKIWIEEQRFEDLAVVHV